MKKVTGTETVSRRMRAAPDTCIRGWSSSKLGRPAGSSATSSPSSTAWVDPIDSAIARSSG